MKNYFIFNLPRSHFVHQAFSRSINAKFIAPSPKWLPYILVPLFNIIRTSFTFYKYGKEDNFLCEGFAGLYFSAILKIFRPNIKIIYHDADPLFYYLFNGNYQGIKKKYLLWFLNKVDYIITDSKLSKYYANKIMGNLKKRIIVVYPFVNVKKFNFKPNLKSKKIVYVGRFSHEKNLLMLLRVFKRLIRFDPDFELVLIGMGKDEKLIKHFILTNKLFTKIKIVPWVRDVAPHLKNALIGYNVSLYEPFGCIGLEYALSGVLPLLGTFNGNKEILDVDQIICNPKNEDEIYDKIINYMKMSKDRKLKLLKRLREKSLRLNKKNQINSFRKAFNYLIKS